jgi:hypothetical protein
MIISHFQCYTFIGFYYMIHVLQEFNLNGTPPINRTASKATKK